MTDTVDSVRLYPKKGKTVRSAILALGMALMMIILIVFRQQTDTPIWMTFLFGLAAIGLISSTIARLRILFSGQPVLEMDSTGFSEKTTFASADKIEWDEILGIKLTNQGKIVWAMIVVENPSELFERQGSAFTKFFMRLNRFTDKGFFRMAVSELPIPTEDFVTMFSDYLDRYGKKHN